jgi:hypothetical protein
MGFPLVLEVELPSGSFRDPVFLVGARHPKAHASRKQVPCGANGK